MATYLTDTSRIQQKINYRLMAGDKVSATYGDAWCFNSLFDGSVPTNCTSIEIYHPPYQIPYTKESIERWVAVLNKLGFPCSVAFEKDMVRFTVKTSDYKHKLHLLSTLMLIRPLIEDCLTQLPEFFFQHEDDHPNCDRFKTMIEMHEKKYSYARDIHMVTYKNKYHDRIVASFEELTHQFEGSKMGLHYSGRGPKGSHAVNCAWWGDYVAKMATIKPPEPKEIEPAPQVVKLKTPVVKLTKKTTKKKEAV